MNDKRKRNARQFAGLSSSQLSKVTGGTGRPSLPQTETAVPRRFDNEGTPVPMPVPDGWIPGN
jgi:hypothetical protein